MNENTNGALQWIVPVPNPTLPNLHARYGAAVWATNGNPGAESMPTTFGSLVVGVPGKPVLNSVQGQAGGIFLQLAAPVSDPGLPFASTEYFANVSTLVELSPSKL